MSVVHTSFAEALLSAGPAADRTAGLGLYGQFIGDWDMDGTIHKDDGSLQKGNGEIHFGWVLQGRAIQDVWIFADVFYGTTLRVYDPSIYAWHILWSDPMRQVYARQVGRAHGRDIEQIGSAETGAVLRWRFTEVTPDSFHWTGERSLDERKSWHLQAEFSARRVG